MKHLLIVSQRYLIIIQHHLNLSSLLSINKYHSYYTLRKVSMKIIHIILLPLIDSHHIEIYYLEKKNEMAKKRAMRKKKGERAKRKGKKTKGRKKEKGEEGRE